MAFRSTTLDIITSYCFAKSFDALDAPNFQHYILVGMDASTSITWISKHFPVVRYVLPRIPEWLILKLNPHVRALVDQRKQLGSQIDKILENPYVLDNAEHQTVYHAYFGDRKALMAEKITFPPVTKEWLLDEGLNLRFAGSDTVGNTCALGTRCILANKDILERLVAELNEAWPDKDRHMGMEALEKLPYLVSSRSSNIHSFVNLMFPPDRCNQGVFAPITWCRHSTSKADGKYNSHNCRDSRPTTSMLHWPYTHAPSHVLRRLQSP